VANAVPAEDLPKIRKLLDDLMNGVKDREKALAERQKVLDGAPEVCPLFENRSTIVSVVGGSRFGVPTFFTGPFFYSAEGAAEG